MNLDRERFRELCTDAVFDRGRNYRQEGRIQEIRRFESTITSAVRGSNVYDVTVDPTGPDIEARCTCPYDGPGECKHVVAVLLEVAADPPSDESGRVDEILADLTEEYLREFVRDELSENPAMRDRLLARFGDGQPSVEEYRSDVGQLFDEHTAEYPVVTEAIDFSRFFDDAQRYRERDRYQAAVAIYRALFEAVDDNMARIDAAYDHYAKTLTAALDGYVECVLAADLDSEAVETHAAVLEERLESGSPGHREPFRRALDELNGQR